VLVLFVLSVLLCLLLVGNKPLTILLVAGFFIFLWFLPRLVDFQPLSNRLGLSDGLIDPEQMRLDFREHFAEEEDEGGKREAFRNLVYIVVLVTLLVCAAVMMLR